MNIVFYMLALIAGTTATLQAGVNGKLRSSLESPVLASLISFLVGTLALTAVYIFTVSFKTQTIPSAGALKQTSWWMWTGGLLGAFFVFTNITVLPKIGFANMFSLIIAGQIILAVVFDHFGVLGNQIHHINPVRIIGVLLLVAGVYIVQKF